MPLTYVDAGVLIAGARADDAVGERASALLFDPERTFAASIWLRLEVEPKARFGKRAEEITFYTNYFAGVERWALPSSHLADQAYNLALRHGLAAMDALHLASALALRAVDFVTTEKRTKPVFRVKGLRLISLAD